mgnify:CR=1 FL=1
MQISKSISKALAAAAPPDPKNIAFGKMFSPHSFTAHYRNGEWRDATIALARSLVLLR